MPLAIVPSGVFVQAGIDRFKKSGSRVFVTGDQLFTLDSLATITVAPILATVGVRSASQGRIAPYLGAGVGWHVLTEESPSLPDAARIREGKVGYHVLGAEFPLARFVSLAGEAQWSTVPKALGETGVSAVFAEDNLGGATFRFKVNRGLPIESHGSLTRTGAESPGWRTRSATRPCCSSPRCLSGIDWRASDPPQPSADPPQPASPSDRRRRNEGRRPCSTMRNPRANRGGRIARRVSHMRLG